MSNSTDLEKDHSLWVLGASGAYALCNVVGISVLSAHAQHNYVEPVLFACPLLVALIGALAIATNFFGMTKSSCGIRCISLAIWIGLIFFNYFHLAYYVGNIG